MTRPAPARSSSRVAVAVLAGLLAMLLYGAQFVISRWSLQRTLSPWDLAALRFTVAGLCLLPLLARHGLATAAGIGWRRAIVLGITVGAPYTLVLFGGLALAPAAHGAVIIPGVTPVVSMLLVWLWFGERPRAVNALGLAVIVVGLVLVSATGAGDAAPLAWAGDLLFFAAGVLWACFTVLARRWQVDPTRGTAVVWVLALAYVPVYAAFAGARLLAAPRGEVLFQAIYQGVGVAILALFFYTWAIRVLGPAFASLFMPLIPVFGVLLAIPVLGEIPSALQLVGMAAVTAGLAVAASARRT
ncbi:MAG: DMT family transporter [Candidatus Rokubacteria bacterium]|nr:DMT family transporter [Candidatus Rokubacteria bacterium]